MKNKHEEAVEIAECKECTQKQKTIDAILRGLGKKHETRQLVMWQGADADAHTILVQVAGLLQDEIAISKIDTILLEAGVRSSSNVVDGVRLLVDKYHTALSGKE